MRTDYAVISIEQGQGLEDCLVQLLKDKQLTITTAESCTGGLVSGRIVNVSGASAVFDRAFVTYANEAKVEELGVKSETLDKYGAVSKQTVKQMAKGALQHAKADVSIAITGIAGPEGGTARKPVGTVYIGIGRRIAGGNLDAAKKMRVYWQKFQFQGNRTEVREQSVVNALQLACKVLTAEE